ncbi:hypothetical protein D9M68_660880 [compost metagenome]
MQLHPGELARSPDANLLRQAREVHAQHRGHEQEFRDHVAARDGINGILAGTGVAEIARRAFSIAGESRAGQGGGAERRTVEAAVPVDEALDVAAERLCMRHQVMAERYRLSGLKVGEARHDRLDMLIRLGGECVLHRKDQLHQSPRRAAKVEAGVVGGLVVARAAGTQLATEGTQPLDQQALVEGVKILIRGFRLFAAGRDIGRDRIERLQHPRQFVLAQYASARKFARMGARPGDVFGGQAEKAWIASRERREFRRGTAGKSASPQRCRLFCHDSLPSR